MTILSTANFYNPFPQFLDQNGSPISGGRLVFRDASTNALKEVYTDRALSVPAQNPQPLGADARPQDGSLYLAEGVYKITLQKPDGGGGWVDYITNPEVSGSISAGADVVSLQVLANVASLRSAVGGFSQYVLVMNYYTNDRGGGFFRWDASSILADDGGSVIQPASLPATGRWIRIFSGSGVLSDEFGAVPSQPAVEGNLLNASAYCSANSVSLTIRGGTYDIVGNLLLSGNYPLIIDGAKFTSATGSLVNLSTSGLTITQIQPMILSTCNLSITTTQDWVSPVYWGAVGDGVTDCYSAFVRMTGRHNAPVLIDRDFNVTAVGAPSVQQITLAGALFKGGKILLQYADAGKFAISGAVQLDDTSSGCLQGFAGLGVFALSVKRVSARVWFSYDSGFEVVVLDTATFNQVIANYTGALVFDGVYDYLMSATTTGINNDCIISNGVLIYTNGARQFGYVQANPYQQVFALDSGGISITPQNRIVYGGWYGIRSGDETGDFDFCLASTSAKTIDFAGLSFNYNPDTTRTLSRNMRDGSITFGGVGAVFLGGASFDTMTFDGACSSSPSVTQKFTNCYFVNGYDVPPVTSSLTAVYTSCRFGYDADWFGLSNEVDLTFQGCQFDATMRYGISGSANGKYGAKFTGCQFKGAYGSILNHFNNAKLVACDFNELARVEIGQSVVMSACEFRNQENKLLLAQTGTSQSNMEVVISNCIFGRITIDGGAISNANTIVSSITITDNIISPEGSFVTPYNGIASTAFTNIATSGHNCFIGSNRGLTQAFGRQGSSFGDIAITLNTATSGVSIGGVNTDNSILPTNPTTTSGAAKPSMDVDTFRFITI